MSAGAGELGSVLFCVSDAGLERMLELSETSSEGDPDDADPLGEHDSIENYDGLIVSYSDADEAEDGEIEHLHDKRLPIGSAFAYPRFLRSGEGDRPREIDDDEARLLTLAMDGLARFCLRERIRLARGETPVRGAVLVRDGDELVVADVRTPAEPRSAQ